MYLTWMNISDGWWLVDWAKSIGGEQQPTTCAAKTSCPPWRVSEPDSAGHFYPVLCFLTWPKVCGQEHTCVQATLLSSGQVVKFKILWGSQHNHRNLEFFVFVEWSEYNQLLSSICDPSELHVLKSILDYPGGSLLLLAFIWETSCMHLM